MKGVDIAKRLLEFSVGVVRMCREMPRDTTTRHIAHQLMRSATGGGANYEEARGAESTSDFIHKLSVANKELREAHYWLQLVRDLEMVANNNVQTLVREAFELIAITTASIRTSKSRQRVATE